jgi:hypothetical protein
MKIALAPDPMDKRTSALETFTLIDEFGKSLKDW